MASKAAEDITENEYDCFAEETFTSPYEEFRRMRRECPVAHSTDFGGFWMVTRYEDVVSMLSDGENYITSIRNIVPSSSSTARTPPLHFDPPQHTPYRKALERALSKGRVSKLTPAVQRHAETLMDEFAARGGGDFAQSIATRLPVLSIGEWIGLTDEQADRLWKLNCAYTRAWVAFDKDTVMQCVDGFNEITKEILADRGENLRDPEIDPPSSLMTTVLPDGNKIPPDILHGAIRQSLVIGLAAPPMVLGSMVTYLAKNPDLFRQLRAEPELLPAALEEFLRLFTPYRGFARTSRTEVEIHGRKIRPKEAIAMSFASANRDETVFEDPDTFQLDRPNISRHIAFGLGPHRCAGMPIARVVLGAALKAMTQRWSSVEMDGEPVVTSMPEIGPIKVPLKVTPA